RPELVGPRPYRMGPRSHEGHLTAQHIEELRQLVKTRAPQKAPDSRYPAIVSLRLASARLMIVADCHGAEFEDVEGLIVEAEALLTEEHRAAAVELDQAGNGCHRRQQEDQQEAGEQPIELALDEKMPLGHRLVANRKRIETL